MIKDIKNDISNENCFEAIVHLYKKNNWNIYLKDLEQFKKCLENSTYLFATYKDSSLVGVIRGLSDNVSINYIQDIIIDPDFHSQGIGSDLLNYVQEKYKVRSHVLLTDNRADQIAFYKKNNFINTKNLVNAPLNCFVQMSGVDLS